MRSPEVRRYVWALAATLVIAFVMRMFVAYFMPNMIWPDEIFQTIEPAHRVVFGYGVTPWEFRDGVRSWILPGMLAGVMGFTSLLTSSVTAYVMACAASLSLISLAPIWATFKEAFEQVGLRAAIVAGAVVTLWFEMIYFAPKSLTEVVAGNCLAVGIVVGGACLRAATRDDGTLTRRRVILFVAMLSLGGMLRIHLSLAAFIVFAIVFRKLPRTLKWTSLAVGGAVVLAAGLLDWITWDYPFQSYIENVRVNVVEDKSSNYGTASWYAYFAVSARVWGVWGLAILALAAVGARRAPLLALGALIVIASHIPIAHKEYRFAYPAILLVIMLAGLGAATVIKWIETHRSARLATLAAAGMIAVWFAASVQGATGFHASKTQLAHVWGGEQDHWTRKRGGLLGMQKLGADPTVCAVALAGIGWGETGGYTYLHRRIPIYPFMTQETLWKAIDYYNTILMKAGQAPKLGPFQMEECWDDVCIYRREGTCLPAPDWDINDALKAGES